MLQHGTSSRFSRAPAPITGTVVQVRNPFEHITLGTLF
jgi:hypothetical protein